MGERITYDPVKEHNVSAKSQLAAALETHIRDKGPLSFHDFMTHWQYGIIQNGSYIPGYYSGAKTGIKNTLYQEQGDHFATSPETSPLFGVMTARQLVQMRRILGNPKDFTIVEMGGGNGSWAHDILHGMRYYDPAALDHLTYKIIDSSPELQHKQRKKLEGLPVQFIQSSALSMPIEPFTGVFLSNELPDTFPIDYLKKSDQGWRELYIAEGSQSHFEPVWVDPKDETQVFLNEYQPKVETGDYYAANLAAVTWMGEMAKKLQRGFVLTIDYNMFTNVVPTVYAGERNWSSDSRIETAEFLTKKYTGVADITTGVDFQLLADAGRKAGLTTLASMPQSSFLFGLRYNYQDDRDEAREARKYFSDRIGNRQITDMGEYRLFEDHEATYDVLIQGKGVTLTEPLMSTVHPGYPFTPEMTDWEKAQFQLLQG